MSEPSPIEWLRHLVRITGDGSVYFGETKVPGCIAENGVTLKPRCGDNRGINRLIIEFLVGEVITDDPTKERFQ